MLELLKPCLQQIKVLGLCFWTLVAWYADDEVYMHCPAADRLTIQVLQINKPKWDAWKMLPEAVKSGAVPFALAHGGLDMHQVDPEACTSLWQGRTGANAHAASGCCSPSSCLPF